MKKSHVLRSVIGMALLMSASSTFAEPVLSKTYSGKVEKGLSTNWFELGLATVTATKVPVKLELERGTFRYTANGTTYAGEVSSRVAPGRLAFYFDDHRLSGGQFVALEIKDGGRTLEHLNPHGQVDFRLTAGQPVAEVEVPEEEPVTVPVTDVETFEGDLDATSSKVWWTGVPKWTPSGRDVRAALILQSDDRFRYEVDGKVKAKGGYTILERRRGRKVVGAQYNFAFDNLGGAISIPLKLENGVLRLNDSVQFEQR